jgi:hypothetical protein
MVRMGRTGGAPKLGVTLTPSLRGGREPKLSAGRDCRIVGGAATVLACTVCSG